MKRKLYTVVLVVLPVCCIVEFMCFKVYLAKDEKKYIEVFNYQEELNYKRESDIEEKIDDGDSLTKNDALFSDNILNVLEKYSDLKETIKSSKISLPHLYSMVPQGLTVKDEFVIMTAYDSKHIDFSKCYIFDKSGKLVNIANLDMVAHVGGIAYDKKNDLLWVSGNNGQISAYLADDILNNNQANVKYNFNLGTNFSIRKSNYSNYVDYLSTEDENLYVGNFTTSEKGSIQKYKIVLDENGVRLEFITDFYVPSMVQGLSFYNYEGQKYMILSRSFGRNNDSSLEIFKFEEEVADYSTAYIDKVSLKLPPMLEQNSIDGDYLYVVFESNAEKYKDSIVKVDSICVLDMKKIINKFLDKKKS